MKSKQLREMLQRYYPGIVFFVLFVFIFRQFFLNGLIPYPSDLLVSFFFPYNSGGWEGFVDFVSHKEFIASDVVRQIYPWRVLAMELVKTGQLPLWNPFAFSGTPLMANLQSAVFYPVNILFFFLNNVTAWTWYILLQPILAFAFMYFFIRSLRLEKPAALLSGLAYACMGYVMIWFELGVVGHTALWLPLALWGIQVTAVTRKRMYFLVTVLALGISLLAGHAQTAVYVYLITAAYFFYTLVPVLTFRKVLVLAPLLVIPFGIAAIQLIPSLEFLSLAARNAETSAAVFYRLQLPFHHLIMILSPDFFGNPATKNFWGVDYNEFLSYIGIIAITFSAIGIGMGWRDRQVRFLVGLGLIGLLFALPTPFSQLLQVLNVPVLGTGIPARSIFVFEFSFIVLAAYGVSYFLTKKLSFVPLIILSILYALLWGIVFGLPHAIPNLAENLAVAKRNLIIPTGLFLVTFALLSISQYKPKLKFMMIIFLIFVAAFEYQYLFNKYLPFAQGAFVFPEHPLISELQRTTGTARVYGHDRGRIETNLMTAWHLHSPEGYDPLYIRTYGELMQTGKTGKYAKDIPRSDANFSESLPALDRDEKQRLMNLLHVRYITDKSDTLPTAFHPDTSRFPEERFKLVWQDRKWQIYENTQVLPRAAVFYNWQGVTSDEAALKEFFSSDFSYRDTLLLSDIATGKENNLPPTAARITEYSPNKVTLQADAREDGVLFLPDAYYPGWEVTVDGVQQTIYRANVALRAVPLSRGKHTVVFFYLPKSFIIGAGITTASLIMILILFTRFRHDKNYEKNHKKT